MPLAVIGMHRSGTSMVSRLANLAGLFIGNDAEMLPASHDNPAGYWEPEWILAINERLLAQMGGTWHMPPPACETYGGPGLEALREEAVRDVNRRYSNRKPWGWKDPRTTLVIPFWRSVVGDIRFAICVRNPLDVAQSLQVRDSFNIRYAIALWHYYTETALRETAPEERMVVFYERFFGDYRGAVAPFLEFAGLACPPEGSAGDRGMREFVDGKLRHHSHTLADVLAHPEIPDYSKALYEGLCTGTPDAAGFKMTDDASWRTLCGQIDTFGRRQLCLENSQLRFANLEMHRLDRILNSPGLSLAISYGRLLRRTPKLYRLARRYAPHRVGAPPWQCPAD